MKKKWNVFALALGVLLSLAGCGEKPNTPKIQYAEFPFRLVYEVNGERITVEDTLICEFDGFKWNEGTGRNRKWISYLESDKEESHVLLLVTEDGTKVYYSLYMPAYYMGDMGRGRSVIEPFNGVFAVGPSRHRLHMMDMNDMLDELGIVLIEWEIAPPIVNEFN